MKNEQAKIDSLDEVVEGKRRGFLKAAGAGLAATLATHAAAQSAPPNVASNKVELPQINNVATEGKTPDPDPNAPPDLRVGYAIVGLGHLAVDQILPAMQQSKLAKVTALVSGDPEKARRIARQYGVAQNAIYDYTTFDQLADNPAVQVIYIVLPNALHADFVVRGARAGKHILCEKPMATSAADCQRMIDACAQHSRKLMIAYRSQYEPVDQAVLKLAKTGKLGPLQEFIAGNSQNQGDPGQWRSNKKLAGGGALPDIGLYCLNASRFLSGEEPFEVIASTTQRRDDPRFKEVESGVHFILRFPSGLTATCSASYSSHESRFYRLQGASGYAEVSPAFGYTGLKMRYGVRVDEHNAVVEPTLPPLNQFTREIDHMSNCVMMDLTPHTPGEEGLQDQRIMDAIYESARTGRAVRLTAPSGSTRGSEIVPEDF
jgi:predicted dehydrogenase